jgi:hypothetical protein
MEYINVNYNIEMKEECKSNEELNEDKEKNEDTMKTNKEVTKS